MPLSFTWLDMVPDDPLDNLRLDEELLAWNSGIVRLWESRQECVVLGHSGQPERDLTWSSAVAQAFRCCGDAQVAAPCCSVPDV